ncbi:MAG: response regulator [Bacteroidota bacterium]
MKKILIVDDDDHMRILITTVFKASGFEMMEADNGGDALEMIKNNSPDLIISDVMMDNMNGFMLREELKSDPKLANIPFILMTGMAMTAGAWEADPTVGYIVKPFIMPDLLAIVEKKLSSV